MTLCQPLTLPAVGGGGYRFLALFEKWLRARGHRVVRHFIGPDVVFANGWSLGWPAGLEVARFFRARVVHRVDGSGAYYGRQDGERVDQRMAKINRHADLTIHQSEWSRSVLTAMLPDAPFLITRPITKDGPVITNPVDLDTFRCPDPCGLPWDRPHVAVVSWSDNPLKGGAAVQRIVDANPTIAFDVVGRMPLYGRFVSHYRVLGTEGLVAVLRNAHALLTMSEREACPNHVLEAMACGLPILYKDSGATAEVVQGAGLAVTEETFGDQLGHVIACGTMFGQRARANVEQYHHPDVVFGQYMKAIEGVL